MVFDCAGGDCRDCAVYVSWRRGGKAAMELAVAVVVRVAGDYVLEGGWNSGVVPDSIWRDQRAGIASFAISWADAGTVGADDAGGAR